MGPALRESIPSDAEAISVEWLADALARAGVHVGTRLASVRSESLGAGNGVFGQVSRLHLTYQHCFPTEPASLILKLPSANTSNRLRAEAFDMHARETGFYRDVAPNLQLHVPRCYLSEFDAVTGRSVLLLEDLGRLQVGDQVAGLGPKRASIAACAIAAAHAQWWDAEPGAAPSWVPRLDGSVMSQLADVYRRQWPGFVAEFRRSLPAGSVDLGERVADRVDALLRGLSRSPLTLAHGDFRADNLYFDAQCQVDPVVVADWQLVCRARGAFDVAYLLCQSVDSDDRARWQWTILQRWHERLIAGGVIAYSFADAVADYKRGALLCVVYAVAGATLDRSNERGTRLAQVQALRTFRAALEMSASELLGADCVAV